METWVPACWCVRGTRMFCRVCCLFPRENPHCSWARSGVSGLRAGLSPEQWCRPLGSTRSLFKRSSLLLCEPGPYQRPLCGSLAASLPQPGSGGGPVARQRPPSPPGLLCRFLWGGKQGSARGEGQGGPGAEEAKQSGRAVGGAGLEFPLPGWGGESARLSRGPEGRDQLTAAVGAQPSPPSAVQPPLPPALGGPAGRGDLPCGGGSLEAAAGWRAPTREPLSCGRDCPAGWKVA